MNGEKILSKLGGEVEVEMTTTVRRSPFYFLTERYIVTTKAKAGGQTFTHRSMMSDSDYANQYIETHQREIQKKIRKYFRNSDFSKPVTSKATVTVSIDDAA